MTLVLIWLQSNSKFALSIEPNNQVLQSYAAHVAELRKKKLPTVKKMTHHQMILLCIG